MALDPQEQKAYVRDKCWTYWGRPPSADEQRFLVAVYADKGADACLTSITDHTDHDMFRAKRGW